MAIGHWYWKKRQTRPKPKPILFASAMTAYTMAGTPGMYISSEPQPGVKDLGLAIEPIVGYRAYAVDDNVLLSYNGVPWPHREPLQALCGGNVFADHDVPKADCHCGIYAWNAQHLCEDADVWGEVNLWGDVMLCPAGYRAEIAYPKTLHLKGPPTRALIRLRDALADAYGVPVTLTEPEVKVPDEIEFLHTTNVFTGGSIAPTNLIYPPFPGGAVGGTGPAGLPGT